MKMSGLSSVGLFAVLLVINLFFVVGKVHNGRGSKGGVKSVHQPETGPARLLKCAQCQGESFEECSKSENTKPCPPGSSARACLVNIKHENSKITIKKQCTMKARVCDSLELKRPKSCLHGDITGDEPCNFCCTTDDCNKGWPRPQFDEHCNNWVEWGPCNAHCGPGNQARNRTCRLEIVGYNLWSEHSIGSVLVPEKREKAQNKSTVSFLPGIPASVTKPKIKWQHKACQIRPCSKGEQPVIMPLPPFINGGPEEQSGSVLFITLWFILAWRL